jgi:predicted permease
VSIVLTDLAYAVRQARANPGFTTTALLTLALAIGANAAIFSIVEAVLLRPLPFRDPARLVYIWNVYRGGHTASAIPDYLDRRNASRTLESIAAFRLGDATMTGGGDPLRVRVGQVTVSFFDVLGRGAAMGRVFASGEDTPGRHTVVVLSRGFWQRAFGGRASAVGQSIVIDGVAHSVVGVMPADFGLPGDRIDVWQPLAFSPAQMTDAERGSEFLRVIGRMRAGATLEQTEADMKAIAASVIERVPRRRDFLVRSQWSADVVPLMTEVAGAARPTLLVLLGAVALVLVAACANLASLLMVRGSFRHREIAVRMALGAGRGRIVRQLVTESLALGLAGGAGGVALAYWLVRVAASAPFQGLPRLDESTLDLPVLGFTVAVSIAASLMFGTGPAFHVVRRSVSGALAGGGRVSDVPARRRARSALIATEVAVAVVVLVGAGLLLRSFDRLVRVDPGFQSDRRFTARVSLPLSTYREPAPRLAFSQALMDGLGAVPGVRAVGLTSRLPLSSLNDTASFTIEGYTPAAGEGSPGGEYRIVGGEYFRAMGVPLLRGRVFDPRDDASHALVAIIDRGAAERYFEGRDPIGGRIDVGGSGQRWREIVGVVGSVRNAGLDVAAKPQVYLPNAQSPNLGLTLIVHADSSPDAVATQVRGALREIDPLVPLYDVGTLDEQLGRSVARQRFATTLLAGLASIGLVLATIGIYGLVAFWVTREVRQIGIRMALGATSADVLRLVLRQGFVPVASGIAAGLVAAATLSRLATNQLFGISPTDPVTYGAIALGLLMVALAACAVPAHRAVTTDAATALRPE